MEGNKSVTVIYLSCSYHSVLLSLYTVVVGRECVCLFVVFCHHVHLDPEIYRYARVHRDTENSFIYYNRDFC